jgi:hypothetical protein
MPPVPSDSPAAAALASLNPSASTTPPTSPEIAALINDLKSDIDLVKAAVAGYRTGGTSGLIAAAAPAVSLVLAQIKDVQAALPVLKSGITTSEGQLTIAYSVVSTALAAFIPHLPDWALPLNSVVVGIVITLYGHFRSRTKSAAATAAANYVAHATNAITTAAINGK